VADVWPFTALLPAIVTRRAYHGHLLACATYIRKQSARCLKRRLSTRLLSKKCDQPCLAEARRVREQLCQRQSKITPLNVANFGAHPTQTFTGFGRLDVTIRLTLATAAVTSASAIA
jgi:hypothetical protein